MRKFTLVVLVCIILILNTGCYDSHEIDENAFVFVVGIDKGVSDKYRFTFQYPALMQGASSPGGAVSGGGTGNKITGNQQNDTAMVTIDAPDAFIATDLLSSSVPRRISFAHTVFFVISEEIAKEGRIGEIFAPMIRDTQVRRNTHVIISKCPAEDFINQDYSVIGSNMSKTMELEISLAYNNSLTQHTDLYEFYSGIKSSYRQSVAQLAGINDFNKLNMDNENNRDVKNNNGLNYLPGELPREGGNRMEFLGVALFDGDRMVGELNLEETRFMLLANGDFKRGYFTIDDPENTGLHVTLDVDKVLHRNVSVNFTGDKPLIHLKIELEGNIELIQSQTGYEDPDLIQVLEHLFEKYINDGIKKVVDKCKALNTDVFYFGRSAVMNVINFPTITAWKSYNWNKHFSKSEVTTEVKFKIRRTGTMIKISPINRVEGKK